VVAEHLADGGEAARTSSALYSGVLLVTSFAFAGLLPGSPTTTGCWTGCRHPGVVRAARVRLMIA